MTGILHAAMLPAAELALLSRLHCAEVSLLVNCPTDDRTLAARTKQGACNCACLCYWITCAFSVPPGPSSVRVHLML